MPHPPTSHDTISGTDRLARPTLEAGSKSAGLAALAERDRSYMNAPTLANGYIGRREVQRELKEAISDDCRYIVTLKGRRGVGKTRAQLGIDIT